MGCFRKFNLWYSKKKSLCRETRKRCERFFCICRKNIFFFKCRSSGQHPHRTSENQNNIFVTLLVPFVSVCALQRLHGPHRKPRVEHGEARQGRPSRNPWPVHLVHEEPRDQTQPCTASVHTAWTHTPPHTDLDRTHRSHFSLRTDRMQQPLRVQRDVWISRPWCKTGGRAPGRVCVCWLGHWRSSLCLFYSVIC